MRCLNAGCSKRFTAFGSKPTSGRSSAHITWLELGIRRTGATQPVRSSESIVSFSKRGNGMAMMIPQVWRGVGAPLCCNAGTKDMPRRLQRPRPPAIGWNRRRCTEARAAIASRAAAALPTTEAGWHGRCVEVLDQGTSCGGSLDRGGDSAQGDSRRAPVRAACRRHLRPLPWHPVIGRTGPLPGRGDPRVHSAPRQPHFDGQPADTGVCRGLCAGSDAR